MVIFRLQSVQNCAVLAAGRNRAKEAAVMSPRYCAKAHLPLSALFPLLPSIDRRNSTF